MVGGGWEVGGRWVGGGRWEVGGGRWEVGGSHKVGWSLLSFPSENREGINIYSIATVCIYIYTFIHITLKSILST